MFFEMGKDRISNQASYIERFWRCENNGKSLKSTNRKWVWDLFYMGIYIYILYIYIIYIYICKINQQKVT